MDVRRDGVEGAECYDVGNTSWKKVGWLRLPGHESKHIYEAGHTSLSTTALP
jgi:hypothetical protein